VGGTRDDDIAVAFGALAVGEVTDLHVVHAAAAFEGEARDRVDTFLLRQRRQRDAGDQRDRPTALRDPTKRPSGQVTHFGLRAMTARAPSVLLADRRETKI
jgi:hypothetical protein